MTRVKAYAKEPTARALLSALPASRPTIHAAVPICHQLRGPRQVKPTASTRPAKVSHSATVPKTTAHRPPTALRPPVPADRNRPRPLRPTIRQRTSPA